MLKTRTESAVVRIHSTSLSKTVDAVNAILFDGGTLTAEDRERVGSWFATRQGMTGAYAGTFAGFPGELAAGINTFTGERITSASARHILGEETSRVLRMIEPRDRATVAALDRADRSLQSRIDGAATSWCADNPGLYCCGKCSVGLWRNLLSGGLNRQQERLSRGVARLRSTRDGEGGWQRFPFWYTVLALSEMPSDIATAELRYAAPQLERVAARATSSSAYGARRQKLAARVLVKL